MRLIIGTAQTSTNPFVRALYMLVGLAAFIVAIFFGAVMLAFVIGLLVIGGAIAAARIWWFRRKFARASTEAPFGHASASQRESTAGRVIEGEFDDISDSDSRRDRSQD